MDESDYAPSPEDWVRDQVEVYEASGGSAGTTLRGMPVVIVTTTGVKTGKVRKVPLMRVEHEGRYAAVASLGGSAKNPLWYNNLIANPRVRLQDGPAVFDMTAREVTGAEKATWWKHAVAAYPNYANYQARTDREIPVFVLEPADQAAG